jgi:hypothetical protein
LRTSQVVAPAAFGTALSVKLIEFIRQHDLAARCANPHVHIT